MQQANEAGRVAFLSADGRTTIHGLVWRPETRPVAVVQLVHGMSEHISRYDDFARFLAGKGFLVCGHDHLGHGESVDSPADWGNLPVDGKQVLVEDVESMRSRADSLVRPGTPHFIFGHSMGSFVTRVYIAHRATGLAGAVICGTGHVAPAASAAGNALARMVSRTRGTGAKSNLLHDMADGAYSKAVKDARTDFDWLSYDEANVDAYIADEACGFMFGAGGYATLTDLTRECCRPEAWKRTPYDLPLLFVSGEEDPVGGNGEGVRATFRMARDAGCVDATLKLYPHMRHEILNETNRSVVYADILAWLEARI